MMIGDVRQGIADAITAGVTSTPALKAYAYVPDSVTVPCVYVQPGPLKYDQAYAHGLEELMLDVVVYVSKADDRASQQRLDAYISSSGPASIKAALDAARGAPGESALGGACDDLNVVSAQSYQWFQHGEARYLGAQLTVRVIGPGA